jgi:hypothetical protein
LSSSSEVNGGTGLGLDAWRTKRADLDGFGILDMDKDMDRRGMQSKLGNEARDGIEKRKNPAQKLRGYKTSPSETRCVRDGGG